MEPIQAAQVSRWAALALALLGLASGCESLRPAVAEKKEQAPTGTGVCRVAAMWSNQVVFTPDPVHGGNPVPGLAGRVYLYDNPKNPPISSEGMLVVDLFDMTKATPEVAPVPLEEWRIDKDTLSRLQIKDDLMGWGYTVFLPWSTYRPELNMVQLRIRFEPSKGMPIYADATRITLNNDMPASTMTTRTITPAAPLGPVAPVLPPPEPMTTRTTITPAAPAPLAPAGPSQTSGAALPPLPPQPGAAN
jgi:hypothetical protein